ncbi:MAG: 3-oxoacyl-[acyl-carrier-protein] reductase [Halanaerobiales bacterium]|nr:3-oxoacyl-[acyl-carrier-protein] reductase [Halanaerobiales bacterium]
MQDLKDKIILITGGSRGIGRAIAIQFAKAGSLVIINYNSNEKAANETLNEVIRLGRKGEIYQTSVANNNEVKEMFKYLRKKYKKIDVLVNNAGVNRDNLAAMMTNDQWNQVIDTNLNGLFYCCRGVLKMMIGKKSGSIINLTSLSGLAGKAGQTNYSASKGGIIGYTKALAKEVGRYGIRVNAIAPGLIDTDMIRDIPEEILKHHEENIPIGRLGKPEEVANVALFLASDLSSYITGHVLNVSGGEYT